ncbi:hypothetical protein CY34DRAFT_468420 [Suillus luteus UH-Slu-Lm8-n1]|uniref:Uncharacterized protein n=1 Tax=Suillus luteus UH-Slu-Lm8-n1 TaxID=930992 RepID=A0A0D0AZK1_9AGAM|nr:hypothetical protein CY34DRAFT_468420 [Suillus luteus UH-Slu-Lm8-n1]
MGNLTDSYGTYHTSLSASALASCNIKWLIAPTLLAHYTRSFCYLPTAFDVYPTRIPSTSRTYPYTHPTLLYIRPRCLHFNIPDSTNTCISGFNLHSCFRSRCSSQCQQCSS